jgi:hypothetical protein
MLTTDARSKFDFGLPFAQLLNQNVARQMKSMDESNHKLASFAELMRLINEM